MDKNVIQINGGITINVDVSVKNIIYVKKIIFGILLHVVAKLINYSCDKILDAEAKSNDEETKTFPTNFNEKNVTCKTQNFYILLGFLLINIALFIAVSVYCYLIKY